MIDAPLYNIRHLARFGILTNLITLPITVESSKRFKDRNGLKTSGRIQSLFALYLGIQEFNKC